MAIGIERPRYYSGGYLRSPDQTAEQLYHIEMRRRLNLALHLSGIVTGLELRPVADGPAGVLYVAAGMAIDHYGREAVLFQPYVLSPGDLSNPSETRFDVWVAYRREATGRAGDGFASPCGSAEATRWRESAEIVVTAVSETGAIEANEELLAHLAIGSPDDAELPDQRIWLGTIRFDARTGMSVEPPPPGTGRQREYIGVRAQRIKPVVPSPAADPTKTVPPLLPPADGPFLPVEVQSTQQVLNHLIVGRNNFQIANEASPPPQPPADPTEDQGTAGTVKVENDLFVRGTQYGYYDGIWMSLRELIRSMTPEVQVQKADILLTIASPTSASGNAELKFQTTSKARTKAQWSVSLVGVQSASGANLVNLGSALREAPFQFDLLVPDPSEGGPEFKITVVCVVQPVAHPLLAAVAATAVSPILKVKVLCTGVFTPV